MNKARLKQLIHGYEVAVTSIIVNGIANEEPRRVVLNKCKKELLARARVGLSRADTDKLWENTKALYTRLLRKTNWSMKRMRKAEELGLRPETAQTRRIDTVWAIVRDDVVPNINKQKNIIADQAEQRYKEKMLEELVSTSGNIFFLCSSHKNPARDHADYEGKMYVSKDWEKRAKKSFIPMIKAYIRNHQVRTVEWVIGPPVYMVRRPNCKHFFIPIPVGEVLSSSVRSLLKRHGAYMEDVKQLSYEQLQYKKYYDQYKLLLSLRRSGVKSDELEKDISRTYKLMLKWAKKCQK